MLSTILVATDGSLHANHAVDWAARLSSHHDSHLVVLHVVTEQEMSRYQNDLPEYARMEKILVADAIEAVVDDTAREAEKRARALGAQLVSAETRFGDPATVIIDRATHCGADLIVMGRRGLSPLAQVAMGSVSNKVSQQTACACLVVK